ncbi:hypothetical protein lerEdw1_006316 [Lerista edwardsae]|nr:hypothetical protein lerEdw1_006316 [Lerista edwardsae]
MASRNNKDKNKQERTWELQKRELVQCILLKQLEVGSECVI